MYSAASEEDFRTLFDTLMNCKFEKKKETLNLNMEISEANRLFKLPELFEKVLCKGSKMCYHKEKKYSMKMNAELKNVLIKYDLETKVIEITFKTAQIGEARQFDEFIEKMLKKIGSSSELL